MVEDKVEVNQSAACNRCTFFRKSPGKGLDESQFYCDVGMRSILRSLRKILIQIINSSSNMIESMSKEQFKNICLRFFKEHIMSVGDESEVNEKQLMEMMYFFMDCPSKENASSFITIILPIVGI